MSAAKFSRYHACQGQLLGRYIGKQMVLNMVVDTTEVKIAKAGTADVSRCFDLLEKM